MEPTATEKPFYRNKHFINLVTILIVYGLSNLFFIMLGYKFVGRGCVNISICFIIIAYCIYVSQNRYYGAMLLVLFVNYLTFNDVYLRYEKQIDFSNRTRLLALPFIMLFIIWIDRSWKFKFYFNIILLFIFITGVLMFTI